MFSEIGVLKMKFIVSFWSLLLILSFPVQSQTFNDAHADYRSQNYGSAFKKFKILAEQNDVRAQGLLGYMYLHGQGTSKNGREAVKWYKKSALGEFYFAHSEIGLLYHRGDFVPQSFAKAGFHYKRCADILGDNDKDGMCHQKTGFAFWNNWFGNTDNYTAQKYFKKAFQLGGDGAFEMSIIMSMEDNEAASLMWINICAAYRPSCKDARNESFAKVSQSEIRKAQKMSNVCIDSNFENCSWSF